MVVLTFVISLAFSIKEPILEPAYKSGKMYGIDTFAYLQQAGQFYYGEGNYAKIDTALGPCMYPAGHLWHYSIIFRLHQYLIPNEITWLVLNGAFHSICLVITSLICYKYFKKDQLRAQMLCSILMSNQNLFTLVMECYNDNLVQFYILASILLMMNNRPKLACFMAATGWSIKANALLFMPCLLGWIQYQYGILTLLMSIIILAGYQVAVALPILYLPIG